ncbi:MAG: prepilin-type N-terminal cleavage/methylation domain-containing protein [Planctomycetota bacterium]|nr:prepilin-type N-terminal cleavage/methylation domain-containing protein [Planctomycetota bacterium]
MSTSRSGLSLVEVVVAFAILTVGLLGVAQTILSGHRLSRESLERARARAAAEGRFSELRTLLRRSSWTASSLLQQEAQTTHDQQFTLVINEHGATRQLDLVDDTSGVNRRIPATMTTYIFATSEPTIAAPIEAGAAGGLGLAQVDLDGNGSTTDTSVQLQNLIMLGVKVEVTWRPGGWQPGDPEQRLQLVGVIY